MGRTLRILTTLYCTCVRNVMVKLHMEIVNNSWVCEYSMPGCVGKLGQLELQTEVGRFLSY